MKQNKKPQKKFLWQWEIEKEGVLHMCGFSHVQHPLFFYFSWQSLQIPKK